MSQQQHIEQHSLAAELIIKKVTRTLKTLEDYDGARIEPIELVVRNIDELLLLREYRRALLERATERARKALSEVSDNK